MSTKEVKGRTALFGAAVPLARMVEIERERMIAELREIVGAIGARVVVTDAAPARRGLLGGLLQRGIELRCQTAGINLVISVAPKPFCKPALLPGFVNPKVWDRGLKELAAHRAHILVAEADASAGTSPDALFDRATAVTLAAAAMAALTEPLGVAWLAARNLVPLGLFGSEMERFMDGRAPLRFWLRWRVLPPPIQAERELGELSGEALNPGVATVGLAPFTGAEVVAPPSTADHEEMLEQLFALASAIIDERWQMKDGGIFAGGEGPPLRLAWRESSRWSPRPHWEVVPRPTPARVPARPAPGAGAATGTETEQESPGDREAERRLERRLRLVKRGG